MINLELLKSKMTDCLDTNKTLIKHSSIGENDGIRFRIADKILFNESLDYNLRYQAYTTMLEILDKCEAAE
jgi:hypothetical protein